MKKFYYFPLSTIWLSCMVTSAIGADNKNPVELSHYLGALAWCQNEIALSDPQRQIYSTLQAQAQKEIEEAIGQQLITQADVLLITRRVQEQGRYLGDKLSEKICIDLSAGRREDTDSYPWQIITSNEGNFVVEIPGKPKSYQEIFETKEGTLTWSIYDLVVTTKDNLQLRKGEYYLIAYVDLTPEYLKIYQPEQLFDNTAKYFYLTLLKQGATIDVKKTQSFTTEKTKAKAFWAKVYERDIVLITYLYQNRLYVNLLLSADESSFKRFLSSFEILESP